MQAAERRAEMAAARVAPAQGPAEGPRPRPQAPAAREALFLRGYRPAFRVLELAARRRAASPGSRRPARLFGETGQQETAVVDVIHGPEPPGPPRTDMPERP